jgi:ATP-binding cassette subfamily C protein
VQLAVSEIGMRWAVLGGTLGALLLLSIWRSSRREPAMTPAPVRLADGKPQPGRAKRPAAGSATSELAAALAGCRSAFAAVALLSGVLNVLMLAWPIDAIKARQGGA